MMSVDMAANRSRAKSSMGVSSVVKDPDTMPALKTATRFCGAIL